MKNMKGRILRKLKSIPTPISNSGIVFHSNNPPQLFHTSTPGKEDNICTPINETFSVPDIVKDSEEEKTATGPNTDGEEKIAPSINSKEERDLASESKPDTFGDVTMHEKVQLLANREPSLEMVTSSCRPSILETNSPLSNSIPTSCFKLNVMENHTNLEPKKNNGSEQKCPPGGNESIILYSTSLRGIRKTFEDCNAVRFLLESFRVVFYERDVSMHLEYREELWEMLGGRVVPPRLFIRGRYIGGADEVVGLHEKGMLRDLLQGIPLSPTNYPCRSCAGMRFLLCSSCNGSRKVVPDEGQGGGTSTKCIDCNENGLVKCSVCS